MMTHAPRADATNGFECRDRVDLNRTADSHAEAAEC
jgi:hypothetical protein